MPEHSPYNLVPARVRAEVDFGRNMAKRTRVHHQPSARADGLGNLWSQSDRLFCATRPAREQSSTVRRGWRRSKFLYEAFDQLDARQWEGIFKRFAVLH